MKLFKNSTPLLTTTLVTLALLSTPSSAFFGIGGCPVSYKKTTNPFGSSGVVPNGLFYSHYLDHQYWGFLEDMVVPQLPAADQPSGGRRYFDC